MSKVNARVLVLVLECGGEAASELCAAIENEKETPGSVKVQDAIKEYQASVARSLDEVNTYIRAEGLDIDHVTTQRRAQKVATETMDAQLPLNDEPVAPKRTRAVKPGAQEPAPHKEPQSA